MNSYFADFTADSCYEILKNKFDNATKIAVKSFEFRAFENRLGFLGEHYFLTINYSIDDVPMESSFFAKSLPKLPAQRDFAIAISAFRKECDMFTKFVPEFVKNEIHVIKDVVPDCYLVSDMNYFILEDLTPKGYVTVNHRKCMSLECVKVCLDALAKLHCTGLIYEEKMKKHKPGKPYSLAELFPKAFVEGFFNKDLEISLRGLEASKKAAIALIDSFESDLKVELFKELTSQSFDNLKVIVQPSTLYRNTICHGDLWSSNIMFKFKNDKPDHCYIIDYQFYRYGPPAQDFLAFIHLSTDREFRRKHMEEVTTYFYQKIVEIFQKESVDIENVLPYMEFLESCEYYKLFCVTQTLCYFQLIMASDEAINNLFSDSRILDDFNANKDQAVLSFCKKDDAYKRRNLEAIADLKEVFIEKGLLK